MSVRDEFITITQTITRDDVNIPGLIDFLNESDFFSAPASTRFHCSEPEGLVNHSLNVYAVLKSIVNNVYKSFGMEVPYSDDTLKIVGLFHDLSKINYYEPSVRNVKVYKENGSKYDEMGRFDWEAQKSFQVKEDSKRYMCGTHGENSARLLEKFIPLTDEEYSAIVNHHGKIDNPLLDFTGIANRFPLVTYLHTADMIATFVIESL